MARGHPSFRGSRLCTAWGAVRCGECPCKLSEMHATRRAVVTVAAAWVGDKASLPACAASGGPSISNSVAVLPRGETFEAVAGLHERLATLSSAGSVDRSACASQRTTTEHRRHCQALVSPSGPPALLSRPSWLSRSLPNGSPVPRREDIVAECALMHGWWARA